MKIAVTGAGGLLGWHATGRIHAGMCAARYSGQEPDHELISIDRSAFGDPVRLADMLQGVDAILHFAGVNRGEETEVEQANPEISRQLLAACDSAGICPHIVYANSVHAAHDTFYGRSKRIAGEILAGSSGKYTDLILPHIFGECARPYYNNVTATLIDQLWREEEPTINADAHVELLHAGAAAQTAIDCVLTAETGIVAPKGRKISVAQLYQKLSGFHRLYSANVFPSLTDRFDLEMFNTYRSAAFPERYPIALNLNQDHRGMLFESAKGGDSSHTFISTTYPGKTRGDHFHLDLVERFLVVQGEAVIRIRKVLSDEVHEFRVSGSNPVAIDQIPLHTHNIENVGDSELVTFFWSHKVFDPSNPDTYADPV